MSESILDSRLATHSYEYGALEETEIRIIELEQGCFEDIIRCKLRTVDRDSAVDTFEAVSYAWGDAKKKASIMCSDKAIQVTTNLHTALKYLRYTDKTRYLWVDALCINQKYIPEQNSQVQHMGEVYGSAVRVLIFLGESTTDVADIITELPRWLQRFRALLDWNQAKVKWTSPSSFTFDPDKLDEEAVQWLTYQQRTFKKIMQLFALPWWGRKWIIQELVQAKCAIVICGQKSITWDSIHDKLLEIESPVDLIKLLNTYVDDVEGPMTVGSLGSLATNGLDSACQLAKFVRMKNDRAAGQGSGNRLIDLMTYSRYFKCSDSGDHLYSLLGIADDLDQYRKDLLEIDYRNDPRTIATNLSICFMSTIASDPLFHFSHVTGIRRHFSKEQSVRFSEIPSTPSWVCNFLGVPLQRADLRRPLSWWDFNAGRGTESFTVKFKVSKDHILSIRGCIIGEITEIEDSDPLRSQNMRDWNEVDLTTWAQKIWQACEHANRDRSPLEVFYELVTFGGKRPNHYYPALRSLSLESAQRWLDYTLCAEVDMIHRPPMDPEVFNFHMCTRAAKSRRLCVMSTGHIGFVPLVAEVGDKICMIPGSQYLSVISPCGEGYYNLIGTCYIQGLMWGEAMDLGLGEEWIHLY